MTDFQILFKAAEIMCGSLQKCQLILSLCNAWFKLDPICCIYTYTYIHTTDEILHKNKILHTHTIFNLQFEDIAGPVSFVFNFLHFLQASNCNCQFMHQMKQLQHRRASVFRQSPQDLLCCRDQHCCISQMVRNSHSPLQGRHLYS